MDYALCTSYHFILLHIILLSYAFCGQHAFIPPARVCRYVYLHSGTKGWNLHKEFDVVPGWKKMAIAAPKEGSLSLYMYIIYIYRLSLHGRELHFVISFTFISEGNHINGTPNHYDPSQDLHGYGELSISTLEDNVEICGTWAHVSMQVSLVKRGGEL